MVLLKSFERINKECDVFAAFHYFVDVVTDTTIR